jgi:Xaa-Pro aminopeptidase
MTTTAAARAERLARARKEQGERGVDALLLGPSADLAYLTGYHPPHLERMTLLVVPAAGDPRLVVPALEAPPRWPRPEPAAGASASATSCGAPSCCGSRRRCRRPASSPPRR